MTTLLTRAPATVPAPSAPTAPTAPTVPAVPAVPRLVLDGVLTRADTPRLEPLLDELRATGARTVEVDLSRVESIDPAVGRLLLRTSWRLGADRRLLLLHPRRQVHRVLRFCAAGDLVVR